MLNRTTKALPGNFNIVLHAGSTRESLSAAVLQLPPLDMDWLRKLVLSKRMFDKIVLKLKPLALAPETLYL
jgi:hypothetical protein